MLLFNITLTPCERSESPGIRALQVPSEGLRWLGVSWASVEALPPVRSGQDSCQHSRLTCVGPITQPTAPRTTTLITHAHTTNTHTTHNTVHACQSTSPPVHGILCSQPAAAQGDSSALTARECVAVSAHPILSHAHWPRAVAHSQQTHNTACRPAPLSPPTFPPRHSNPLTHNCMCDAQLRHE